ncbi:helix-turn-helix domain-containing protein [Thalassomonas sp. RHCl1]|uniref:helix-turn-helix domain-containing protein n=1 Tax=Thalassomonas sp. RHCl1 TaxID=2995320 RepID=UPI00248BDD44|nr:helix-turn-helix domain-containing protein [Thalassomonas sp. RHCl1]
MIHWLQAPKSSTVAAYVECYWLIEKKPGAQSFQFPKLNPDPCAHLIISPDDQAYHYDKAGASDSGKGCHLIFPHLQTFQLDHVKPFIHLGVKFRIGALYSIEVPGCTHPLLDYIEPMNLSDLIKQPSLDASELLKSARESANDCCKLLDSVLSPWLLSFKQDRYSALTYKAVELLGATPISELGNKLHCAQRTLERTFNKVTGMTLKQCQSMNKLEALLEYLYQRNTDDIDWVEIAYQFGFSDQPHLIRYLKSQLGLTPHSYAKERNLTIDAYGGISQHEFK